MGKFWNAENLIDMLAGWHEGQTASEIAEALGCTRGAVLGKLHRLGVSGNMDDGERFLRRSRGVLRSWSGQGRKPRRKTRADGQSSNKMEG